MKTMTWREEWFTLTNSHKTALLLDYFLQLPDPLPLEWIVTNIYEETHGLLKQEDVHNACKRLFHLEILYRDEQGCHINRDKLSPIVSDDIYNRYNERLALPKAETPSETYNDAVKVWCNLYTLPPQAATFFTPQESPAHLEQVITYHRIMNGNTFWRKGKSGIQKSSMTKIVDHLLQFHHTSWSEQDYIALSDYNTSHENVGPASICQAIVDAHNEGVAATSFSVIEPFIDRLKLVYAKGKKDKQRDKVLDKFKKKPSQAMDVGDFSKYGGAS